MKRLSRRGFLKLGALGGAGLALPLGTLQTARSRISAAEAMAASPRVEPSASPQVEPFSVPLPIPPVLKPVRSDGATDYYKITQREGEAEILPGLKTTVWGHEGIYPGPTIEARSGRKVMIRQKNELPRPVSVHLHGGRTPPESDGYPTDLIWSGESKDYEYPNDQRGATLWYHDHRMDFTGPQLYKGLSGFYIVRDDAEDDLPLPEGEKEVPLMIADRIFEEDGSFYYPSIDPSLNETPGVLGNYMRGVSGDTILVNGVPWPFMEVSNTRYRLRILNASNARLYELALDPPPPGGEPFVQIGSDGGLLEAPISHDRIPISPAERFDVVVDFSRYPVGAEVTLKNLYEEGRTSEVMRFDVVRKEKDESEVPPEFAPLEELDPAGAAATRSFQFERGVQEGPWVINKEPFDPERMDAQVDLDSTEVWEFSSDAEHPIHVHLVHFRVLSRDGKAPDPTDAGWKDTVLVRWRERVRMVANFSGYQGKYVFHCHNLEHEDMKMMANFEVV